MKNAGAKQKKAGNKDGPPKVFTYENVNTPQEDKQKYFGKMFS